MLARIDRAFERERAFTSDASHELRTPLSILKAEVDLALESGRLAGGARGRAGSVSEETDRLSRLAEDLLVLARADEGRLPLSVEPLDLGALARRRRRALRRARGGGRAARSGSTATAVRLSADPLRLDQALTNLIDNALRYGAGDVGVHASRRDGRAELHVTDDGAGLPPELRGPRLRPLRPRGRREHPRRRRARPLDRRRDRRAHGGSVHADNRPEGGADVWISLPAAD